MQMIEQELKNEKLVKTGELTRKTVIFKNLNKKLLTYSFQYSFDELTPVEQVRAEAMARQKEQEAREAAARALEARNEERDRRYSQMQEALLFETVTICLPHTSTPEGNELSGKIEELWAPIGINVIEKVETVITPEIWEEVSFKFFITPIS